MAKIYIDIDSKGKEKIISFNLLFCQEYLTIIVSISIHVRLNRTGEPVQVFRCRIVNKLGAPLDSVDIAIVARHAITCRVSSVRDA